MRRGCAPGIVALAAWADRNEIHCSGVSDLTTGAQIKPDSLFRIASVSKVITAVTAMTLVDAGLLDLDEPIGRWLPELAGQRVVADIYGSIGETAKTAPATLRHLLSMTGGAGSYMGQGAYSELISVMQSRDVFSWTSPISADELLARLADLPLMFAPGERWLYHLGIELAGILIERATGERLGSVMKTRLLEPLGMTDTGFFVSAHNANRLVQLCQEVAPGRYLPVPDWEPDRTRPPRMDRGGGGLISSARDLAKIGRLLLDGGLHSGRRLLSEEAIAEMIRDQVSPSAKTSSPVFSGFWEQHGFGLGLCIAVAPNRVSSIPGRYGWWGGTGTALFMDPERDVAMVTLTQRMINALDDSGNADSLMRAMLGK